MDLLSEVLVGAPSLTPQPTLNRLVLSRRGTGTSSVVSANADYPEMHSEADAKLVLWKGIKTYPQAAAWFVLLSSIFIMEGYDTSLIGSLFAYPAFAQKYGGAP
jgi:hypothetical protein